MHSFRTFYSWAIALLIFVGSHSIVSAQYENDQVCNLFWAVTAPSVKAFFKEHGLKSDGGNIHSNKKGSVVVETDQTNMVSSITLDATMGYDRDFPFGFKSGMTKVQIESALGFEGTLLHETFWNGSSMVNSIPKYLSYFFEEGLEVRFYVENSAIGKSNSLYKVVVTRNRNYTRMTRFIRYHGGLSPKAIEEIKKDSIALAERNKTSVINVETVYPFYANEPRYYNQRLHFQLTGSNGKYDGTLRILGRPHMRGSFIYSNLLKTYCPDKYKFITLYDKKDTTISITAKFEGFYKIVPGTGDFQYHHTAFPLKITDEIGVWMRAGMDTLDNQYILEYMKFKVNERYKGFETKHTDQFDQKGDTLTIGGWDYSRWYQYIYRGEKIVSVPAIEKMQKEFAEQKRVLDAAAQAVLATIDPGTYQVLEVMDASMDGLASTCNKTFTNNVLPSDNYTIFYLFPEKYLLNMRLAGLWVYTINGEEIKEAVGTNGGMPLGGGVTGIRHELSSAGGRDGACCYKLVSSLERLANSETFPVKMIIAKRNY